MQVPMAQLGVSQHSSHDPNVTRVYAAIQEREWFSERGAMQSATNLDIESEWHASPSRNVCLSACLDPAFSGGGPSTASTRICRVGHTPRGGTHHIKECKSPDRRMRTWPNLLAQLSLEIIDHADGRRFLLGDTGRARRRVSLWDLPRWSPE